MNFFCASFSLFTTNFSFVKSKYKTIFQRNKQNKEKSRRRVLHGGKSPPSSTFPIALVKSIIQLNQNWHTSIPSSKCENKNCNHGHWQPTKNISLGKMKEWKKSSYKYCMWWTDRTDNHKSVLLHYFTFTSLG